jgi:hypothetical protein
MFLVVALFFTRMAVMVHRKIAAGDNQHAEPRLGGRDLAWRIVANRREIARLRRDIRLREAEMQALIAQDLDATAAADRLIAMRNRIARLVVVQAALMEGAVIA